MGTVVEGTEKVREYNENGKTISYEAGRVRFIVEESFKGVTSTEITIFVMNLKGTSCEGTSVGRGKKYLVYAGFAESVGLSIGPCSPTKPMETAKADLEFLRKLPQPGVGGRLYGHVGAETGEKEPSPVAGVTIVIEDETHQTREAKTDKEGNYQIDGLRPGKYLVKPLLPDHYTPGEFNESREAELSDRGCAQASFWVKVDGRIAGRLVDSVGRGAHAMLILDAVDRRERRILGFANDDGQFEITGVSPGEYILYFNITSSANDGSENKEGYYYPGSFDREKAQAIKIALAQKINGYDFTLPSKLKVQVIDGFVKNADGTPAPNIRVLVNLEDRKAPGIYRTDSWPPGVTTDEHGRFEIHGFKGNTYEIWAREEIMTAEGAIKKKPLRSELVRIKLDKDVSDLKLMLNQTGDPHEKQKAESAKKAPDND